MFGAAIFGFGVGGVILFLVIVSYNESKANVYNEHMQKVSLLREQLDRL